MRKSIQTQHEINVSANNVWSHIAKGDQVENWLPIIKSSTLQEGNRRFCQMTEGGDLEETILKSDVTKTFMYRIDKQEAFPASDIVGTMRVVEGENSQSRLFWDVEMEVASEEDFAGIKPMIEQVYRMSAEKLGQIS